MSRPILFTLLVPLPSWQQGTAQAGWMQGAAGISASLIRYHLVTTGHPKRILRLPDEVRLP